MRHFPLSTFHSQLLYCPFQGGLMGDSNPPRCGGLAYVALSGRRPF
ncbi:MAG: hypothetical protein LBE12_09430 [Planctomycetaceae bacterium]|nr:hypothetical protein [Planctomycetaceae bacterium]